MTDPIVDEIRATRERLAMEVDGDIHAIALAAKKRQDLSGVQAVSRSAKRWVSSIDQLQSPSAAITVTSDQAQILPAALTAEH